MKARFCHKNNLRYRIASSLVVLMPFTRSLQWNLILLIAKGAKTVCHADFLFWRTRVIFIFRSTFESVQFASRQFWCKWIEENWKDTKIQKNNTAIFSIEMTSLVLQYSPNCSYLSGVMYFWSWGTSPLSRKESAYRCRYCCQRFYPAHLIILKKFSHVGTFINTLVFSASKRGLMIV